MVDRSSTPRILSTPTTMETTIILEVTCPCFAHPPSPKFPPKVSSSTTISKILASNPKTTETINTSQDIKVNFLSSSRTMLITRSSIISSIVNSISISSSCSKMAVQVHTMGPSTNPLAAVQTKCPSMNSCAEPKTTMAATTHNQLSCSSRTVSQATARSHALLTTTTPTQDRSKAAGKEVPHLTRDSVSSNSRWELDSVAGQQWPT
jgi:hypothetical protein